MSQQELLRRVVGVLDGLGIAYMLTGSLVSSYQGEPRATHDVDLVVVMREDVLARLMLAFPSPDFYLSESAMRNALRLGGMFNLIELNSGHKVDFWLLTEAAFDRSRFARRRKEQVLGLSLWISTPEDTILMKLKWAKDSGLSEKQFGDALRVYEVQYPELDLEYIRNWSRELSLSSLWDKLIQEARPSVG